MTIGVAWSTRILCAVAAALLAAGCGDGGDDAPTPSATTRAVEAPLPGLPRATAGFEDWFRLNDRPIAETPDTPHGASKNVYLNRDADEVVDGFRLRVPMPPGTVVVKTGSRGTDPMAFVSVMEKVPDFDPQHGDWRFTEYVRTGEAAGYTVLAEDSACWACHAGAADSDWLFTEPG